MRVEKIVDPLKIENVEIWRKFSAVSWNKEVIMLIEAGKINIFHVYDLGSLLFLWETW